MGTGTIGILIDGKMAQENISIREAARQIGVAHSTLLRIRETGAYDLESAQKIADWLGVPLSNLLETEGDDVHALAAQIAAVLQQEPELARVFSIAMQRITDGEMDVAKLKELAAYAAFRIGETP